MDRRYVDLNPIRAAMAQDLESSDYTAVQHRIHELKDRPTPDIPLALFQDQSRSEDMLPMYLPDYLELVDWTGRATVQGKRDSIPRNTAQILDSIGFDKESWIQGIALLKQTQIHALGSSDSLQAAAGPMNRQWFRGASDCQAVFDNS